MGLLSSLYTGTGYWNPLACVLASAVAAAVVYSIWKRGEGGYKKGTVQTTPFISGNPEPEKAMVHVPASNLYWGYLDALKGYYDLIVPVHNGFLNDYVLWYLGITALLIVVVVVFV
jgi:hypothetical protein